MRVENKSIIITDPCYILVKNGEGNQANLDWSKCNYGENMSKLGFKNYLVSDTGYGDWSCTTFNCTTGEKLGNFSADSGQVAVFLLDEVLDYNPEFDYWKTRPWTTTLIENFTGDVEIHRLRIDVPGEESQSEVRVLGFGNINFYTTQTGY